MTIHFFAFCMYYIVVVWVLFTTIVTVYCVRVSCCYLLTYLLYDPPRYQFVT